MIDLRQIECFCEVARCRSFSRAASILSMDPSGLSRQVRKLEDGLSSKLLYRNGRGVELTESGTVFHEAVSRAIAILKNAYEEVAVGSAAPKGLVTLGLPTSVSALVAVPLLRIIQARFPEIRLHLMDGSAANVQDWLLAGRVDVAVLSDHRHGSMPSMQPLVEEDLYVIGLKAPPRSVSGAGGLEISFADLAGLPLMLPSTEHGVLAKANRTEAANDVPLQVLSEIDSPVVLKEMIRAGIAYAVLPIGCVFNEIVTGDFVACRIVGPTITNTLFLGCASNRPFSAAMRHVCASLCKLVTDTASPSVGWLPLPASVYSDRIVKNSSSPTTT